MFISVGAGVLSARKGKTAAFRHVCARASTTLIVMDGRILCIRTLPAMVIARGLAAAGEGSLADGLGPMQ
jgi:hypothetical protein